MNEWKKPNDYFREIWCGIAYSEFLQYDGLMTIIRRYTDTARSLDYVDIISLN